MSQGSIPDDRASDADISLGRELRRAREVRGISVAQIAQETKINERYIHALENDRFDLLPGQPYTANFVRSIARCIGADEEELIDYLNYHLRILKPERRDETRTGGAPRPRSGLPVVLLLGAVLVVIALTIVLRDDGGSSADPAPGRRDGRTTAALPAAGVAPLTEGGQPVAPAATAVTAAAPVLGALATAPVASAPLPSAPQPSEASAPEASAPAPVDAPTVRLVWRARGWIQAEQGTDFYAKMRQPGDELTWTLDEALSLQIGNSGQVDMFIDGQPAKPLGGENETRRLVLDARNWKSFLR